MKDKDYTRPQGYQDVSNGQFIYCAQCGARMEANQHFCVKCGQPLQSGQPVYQPPQPVYQPPQPVYQQVIVQAPPPKAKVPCLLFAILGIVFCWLPIIGLLFSILGLVLSIVAAAKKRGGKAAVGIVFSVIALICSLYFTLAWIIVLQ